MRARLRSPNHTGDAIYFGPARAIQRGILSSFISAADLPIRRKTLKA